MNISQSREKSGMEALLLLKTRHHNERQKKGGTTIAPGCHLQIFVDV